MVIADVGFVRRRPADGAVIGIAALPSRTMVGELPAWWMLRSDPWCYHVVLQAC